MITFLTTFVPNPRLNKRIAIAKKHSSVSVVCIDRKDNHLFVPAYEDVTYRLYSCDVPTSKHFFKRVLHNIRFYFFATRQIMELKPHILHIQGLDCLFFAYLISFFRKQKIIYEVADIRECMLSDHASLSVSLLSFLETRFLKRVTLLILTSRMYYDVYYYNKISLEKTLVIPNTPNLTFFKDYKKRQHDRFTVGFIGGIRYIPQLKNLVDVAQDLNIRLFFAGGAFESSDEIEIKEYCQNKDNITFYGRFEYNKEIASLYEKVDCVYSVYDADNLNCKVALPNKLYESVYCELPIIVAKETYLGSIVEKYRIGATVSHVDKSDLLEVLHKMIHDESYYSHMISNCQKHKEEILQSNIHSVFEKKLIEILK